LDSEKATQLVYVPILGPKHIGVMTLNFQGRVTLSVTSPFDLQVNVNVKNL